jgi:putative transposase
VLVLEYKLVGNPKQQAAVEEAIRTATFIRNKCLRLWMDGEKIGKYDLSAYCVPLSKEFEWAGKLNSQARQAAAERTWSSITRFYKECAEKPARIASPKFKKRGHSVEYKTTGWKLSEDRRFITFTDGFKIGRLKLLDKRLLNEYPLASIKRVRLVRRADGFYCQFVTDMERNEPQEPTGKTVGIDVGLLTFYTDSNGESIPCPKPLRKAEKRLKKLGRRLSRKKKGSSNRDKASQRLARQHLKVARRRKDFAAKAARALVRSNDLVAYEALPVRNLVHNHYLAKSIHDAAWSGFLAWLVYYGQVFGKVVVAVPPAYTSQDCSVCAARVPKALSERTHRCQCGAVMDRDQNAARNILQKGLLRLANDTAGHAEIGEGKPPERLGRSGLYNGSDPVASWIAEPRTPPL